MEALQQAPQRWTLKGQCPENEKGLKGQCHEMDIVVELSEYNIRFSVSLSLMEALQQSPQRWTLKGQCQDTEMGFKGAVSGD
jgi:hypothetical protein